MVIECAGGLLASPRAVRSARRPGACNQQYLIPARGVCLVAPSSPPKADRSAVVDSSGPGVAVGVSHCRTALDVSVRQRVSDGCDASLARCWNSSPGPSLHPTVVGGSTTAGRHSRGGITSLAGDGPGGRFSPPGASTRGDHDGGCQAGVPTSVGGTVDPCTRRGRPPSLIEHYGVVPRRCGGRAAAGRPGRSPSWGPATRPRYRRAMLRPRRVRSSHRCREALPTARGPDGPLEASRLARRRRTAQPRV